MRKFLLSATLIAAAAGALAITPLAAHAAVMLDGIWGLGLGLDSSHGGPSLSNPSGQLGDPFAIPLVLNGPAVTFNLDTLHPAAVCFGSGCVGGSTGTETDSVGLGLTGLQLAGIGSAAPIQNYFGTFTAKYSGSILPCAAGDGVSPNPGQTDCVVWTGGGNSGLYNGKSQFSVVLPGTGDTLFVTLNNVTDWSVTPSVTFQIDDATAAPEPASLALLTTGLVGLGFGLRRRRV